MYSAKDNITRHAYQYYKTLSQYNYNLAPPGGIFKGMLFFTHIEDGIHW